MKTEYGEWTDGDGNSYEGSTLGDGTPHGKGKFICSDGTIIEGDFLQGEITGIVRCETIDNYIYVGEFKGGKMHGKGILTSPFQVIEGYFENNCAIGDVRVTEPDGTAHIEHYEDGICTHKREIEDKDDTVFDRIIQIDESTSNITNDSHENESLSKKNVSSKVESPNCREGVTTEKEKTYCPYCQKQYAVKRLNISKSGKKVKCKVCGKGFTIFSCFSNFFVPGLGVMIWGKNPDYFLEEYNDRYEIFIKEQRGIEDYYITGIDYFGISSECHVFYEGSRDWKLSKIQIKNTNENGLSADCIHKIVGLIGQYYCNPSKNDCQFDWITESTIVSFSYEPVDIFKDNGPVNFTINYRCIEESIYKSKTLSNYIVTQDIDSINNFIDEGNTVDYYNDNEDVGNTPLHDALDSGSNKIFFVILNNITEDSVLIHEDKYHESPLSKSVKFKTDNIFRILIERMTKLKHEKEDYKMLVMIQFGTDDHIIEFIDKCSNINYQDSNGDSALHIAVRNNRDDVIKHLLGFGASVNIRNNNGLTPIYYGISNYSIFKLLLDNCASLEIPDNDGNTVLDILSRAKHIGQDDTDYDKYFSIRTDTPMEIFDLIPDVAPKIIMNNMSFSRHAIPAAVKREVWRRDYGRCVECNSQEYLEYDHIIPVSKGGANTTRNVQLLCQNCNRSKSDKIM